MIIAVKERWKDNPCKISMFVHKGKRVYVSCTITDLQEKETKESDAWLHLQSIGEETVLDLPIKFHKHFNKLAIQGKRLDSYILTEKYAQSSFEIGVGEKKKGVNAIGIDTGIKALASLNSGKQYDLDTEACIERIKRCEHGFNG